MTNAPAPFYLLGSYHALRASDYPLAPEIDSAIKECHRFIFEYDMVHTDPRTWDAKMKEAAHYPSGVNLKQKLRPEAYAALQKIARTTASKYNDTKPWAIAMFMFHHPGFRGIHSSWGVESYVRSKAPSGSEFGGLETLDEHIHVLSDMTDIEGEVFLLEAIVYGDSRVGQFSNGVSAWKKGDTNGILQVYSDEEKEAPFLLWRLVDHRNANWIPKIEGEIKSGKPTMIVAGARHFCGPHSVVAMLKARGYKVEQL